MSRSKLLCIKISLVFLILLSIKSVHAQNNTPIDKIYLYDGSVLVGKINTIGDTIQFMINEGNVIQIPKAQIKKVVMGYGNNNATKVICNQKKLYLSTQLSVLTGDNGTGISINQSIGMRFTPIWSAGIGLGYDNYYLEDFAQIVPVYLEGQANFISNSSTPFFRLRAGYGFATVYSEFDAYNDKGSLFINPSLGYRLNCGKANVSLLAGLKFQNLQFSRNSFNIISDFDYHFVRYDFGIMITY